MDILTFSIYSMMMLVVMPFRTIKPETVPQKEILLHNLSENTDVKSIESIKIWMLRTFDEMKIRGLRIEDVAMAVDQSFKVNDYGEVTSYQISLKNVFPTGIQVSFYLLINSKRREGCLIALDTLDPIVVSKSGAKNIAGRLGLRSKEIYIHYAFRKDRFFLSFNSLDFCEFGIIVGSFRPECTNYKDERLRLKYRDVNQDAIEDILFKGTIEYYCAPSFDRDELQKQPIKQGNVEIAFISCKDSTGIQWVIRDKNICGKLPVN